MSVSVSDWIYEEFYYGNGSCPAYTIWRRRGDEYYVEIELGRVAHVGDGTVLWSYYKDHGWVEPFVIFCQYGPCLNAWKLSTRESYENAKKGAWTIPNSGYRLDRNEKIYELTELGFA